MYLGVDVGGTNTKLGVVDEAGTFVLETSFRTTAYSSADHFLSALEGEINRLISLLNSQIKGIGLGAPSADYRTGTITNAANLGWTGKLDIKQYLEKAIGSVIRVTNDANLPAIGEMTYGAAKGMQNFITISLGTGLGSGVVCNGSLVAGHHGMAGELGHAIVDPNGRICGCGRRGCLETYVSATGLKRTVFDLLAQQNGGQSTMMEYSFQELTADQITSAALDGDQIAIDALEITGTTLGKALANVLCLIDPEAIFLVGGMAYAGELLFKPTRKAMKENMLNNFNSEVEIRPSLLPLDRLSVLGACGLISGLKKTQSAINTMN